MSNSMVT